MNQSVWTNVQRYAAVVLIVVLRLFVAGSAKAVDFSEALLPEIASPWTGDLDGIRERRALRVLVPYSLTFMFFDRGELRGLAVEALGMFEKQLNGGQLGSDLGQVAIVIIPTARDRLLPDLIEGRGDLVVGDLTITPDREKLVDFSNPVYPDVRELIITAADAPQSRSFSDLRGLEVHVRRSSSYYESLIALNKSEVLKGNPIRIVDADEALEDEDLVEMVDAGLVPAVVMDSNKYDFWKQIYTNTAAKERVPIRSEGDIGWAFRKESPQLRTAVNRFVQEFKKGSLLGNILFKRYLSNTKWLVNISSPDYQNRMRQLRELFETYGARYDIDWRLIAAQSFQETKFDPTTRSRAGAVGLMQVKPSTARDPNVNIPDISTPDANVHAGVKYLRFLADRYFSDPDIDAMNRIFFALAAYNAGPARVVSARARATNPNVWFGEVEHVVAKRIGMEPVRYVSNIHRYYIILSQLASAAPDQAISDPTAGSAALPE